MAHKRDYKPEDIAFPEQHIVSSELVSEMEKSYIEYAMSVIVGRALPDVRDGLKPVHRRRTQLHAHRCQQQLLRVEPEPQPVRERRAARRSRCDLQAEHGQPHAGQFLPQRHICSPPIAFSTIYMVSGVELCHRICYTEHRNFSKEASS